MEKRTIGNFISVLRRAQGMTQKELGEKLFVSDKTVSRWERDECAPDLSLIPVIADLFGVTTDELLRGERKNESDHTSEKASVKSERQYRNLLRTRLDRCRNSTLIAVGISLLGSIGAMICNLGFTRANIGFCVGLIFLIAGAILQICTFNQYYLRTDDEDKNDETQAFNTRVILLTRNTAYLLLALFGAILPLIFIPAYMGLDGLFWLLYGGISALLLWGLGVFLYHYAFKKLWMEKGILVFNEQELYLRAYRLKLIKRLTCVALSVAAVLGLALAAVRSIHIRDIQQPLVFDTFEEFKAFAESDENVTGGYLFTRTGSSYGLRRYRPKRYNCPPIIPKSCPSRSPMTFPI